MRMIAAVVLAAGVYVVLSPDFTPKDAHWAFAAIGVVFGLWLRRPTRIMTF